MGVIDDIIKRLKSVKPQSSNTYILRPEPDIVKQTSDALRRENAQLKAQMADYEAQIAHIKELNKKEDESDRLVSSAIKTKRRIEHKKSKRRAVFKLVGHTVKARNISERPFELPFLYGFELEAVDDEPDVDFRWNILLSEKKDRKIIDGRIYGSQSYRNLFKNPDNIVNAIQSGVIDLSIQDDGMFKPKYPQNVPPEILINAIKGEYGEAISILQDENNKLKKRLGQEMGKRRDSEIREIETQDSLDEVGIALELSQKATENRGAIVTALIDKLKSMDTEHMRFLIPAMEAPLNKSIQEMQSKALENLVDNLDSRINEIIPEGKRKSIRNELLDDFSEFRELMPKDINIVEQKEGEKLAKSETK